MKKKKRHKKEGKAYRKALAYLFENLPMYQREGGVAFKPGLDNTIRLLENAGNPQKKFKAIHVAGTNGKGSVSHMLTAVLMKQGYKTGLYTSPHLIDFRERIRVNGKKVSRKFVVDFVENIRPLCEELKPSFFEITVAMCFSYFSYKKVEYAVVETGMGGRLDSTNVLTPIVSVITNIGLEHTQFLGDTLSKIAFEKAGIIKKGVPVVLGESHDETLPVFQQVSAEQNAAFHMAEHGYQVSFLKQKKEVFHYTLLDKEKGVEFNITTDLGGLYQEKNIATVLKSIEVLQTEGHVISQQAIINGVKNVKQDTGLMGRWDVVRKKPGVVLDTAHNKYGILLLNEYLKQVKYHKLYIIFGMVNDKNTKEVFQVLPRKAFYIFTKAENPRSLNVIDLQKEAEMISLKGITCANINLAYKYALKMATKEDMILVMGSNFLVGDFLGLGKV